MLPDGSGSDLYKEIKENRFNEGIPVLIMSALAQLRHMTNICQPDDLISKPFDIDNLSISIFS